MVRPYIVTPELQTKVHTAIIGLFYLGVVLIACAQRKCVSRSANAVTALEHSTIEQGSQSLPPRR